MRAVCAEEELLGCVHVRIQTHTVLYAGWLNCVCVCFELLTVTDCRLYCADNLRACLFSCLCVFRPVCLTMCKTQHFSIEFCKYLEIEQGKHKFWQFLSKSLIWAELNTNITFCTALMCVLAARMNNNKDIRYMHIAGDQGRHSYIFSSSTFQLTGLILRKPSIICNQLDAF